MASTAAGTRATEYELLEQIGAGSFSEVHRAHQRSVDRDVAIKIVHPALADKPGFVRLFEREAQVVSRLEHPHIVPLFDFWREPGGAFLVMRLLRGRSAEQRLTERGPFTLDETRQLVAEIGEALTAAHAQGVVHRDVKPANVLYDEIGHAYLSDFGIAVETGRAAHAVDSVRSGGSPLYAAPEQLRDGAVSAAVDQYAFATLVWEVLTGRAPWTAGTVPGLLAEKADGPLPALGLWRPELPSAVDSLLRRASDPDPSHRFATMTEVVEAFQSALGGRSAADAMDAVGERLPVRDHRTLVSMQLEHHNPYKGLRAFAEADAADFFGRTALVDVVVERVVGSSFVSVVGPSGVGKSSVVRAGVVPALRRGAGPSTDGWYVVTMTPGVSPFDELGQALTGMATVDTGELGSILRRPAGIRAAVDAVLPADGSELLVVIDQFEEVFTVCPDEEERAAFLAGLAEAVRAPASRVRVIVTLRADAYDRPLQYRAFAELVEAGLVTVMTPSPEELTEAIVRPAEGVGVVVERALVAQLVTDVADRPSALPLLQYALTELYEQRANGVMTLEAYRAIGGVSGALANRADEVTAAIGPGGAAIARHVFTSLVRVGAGTIEARRGTPVAAITSGAEDRVRTEEAIERYAEQRLLSYDRDPATRSPTIAIAHEALLRCWPQLARWIEEDRDDLSTVEALNDAASRWDGAERQDADLLRGPRLLAATGWAGEHPRRLSPLHREYLGAAQHYQDAELRAARRTTGRLRRLAFGLGAVVIVAATAGVVAVSQRQSADRQRRVAEAQRQSADEQRQIAQSETQAADQQRQVAEQQTKAATDADAEAQAQADLATSLFLSSEAGRVRESQPALGAALAAEAVSVTKSPPIAAYRTLIDARTALTERSWIPVVAPISVDQFGPNLHGIAFSPDGDAVVVASSDNANLRVVDPRTGVSLARPVSDQPGQTTDVAFDPDGTMFVSAGTDGTLRRWDSRTGALIGSPMVGHDGPVLAVAFSADGRLVASGGRDGTVRTWDSSTGQEVGDPLEGHQGSVTGVVFAGDRLVSGGVDATIRIWDVAARRPIGDPLTSPIGAVHSLAVDAAGTRLLSAGPTSVVVWDLAQRAPIGPPLTAPDFFQAIAVSPDGTLAALSGLGTVTVVDLTGSAAPVSLDQPGSLEAHSVAFARDGKRLATANGDGTVRVWARTAATVNTALTGHRGVVSATAFSPDGTEVASVASDGTLRLWDTMTRAPIVVVQIGESAGAVAFGPTGSVVATAGEDGVIRLWDPRSGRSVGSAMEGHQGRVDALVFNHDGTRLFTGGADLTLRTWDVSAGQEVGAPVAWSGRAVSAMVLAGDDQTLIVGDQDGNLRWIDAPTGSVEAEERVGRVVDLAIDASGARLAVVNGGLRFFDVVTHAELSNDENFRDVFVADSLASAAFGPAGTPLVTTSDLGEIGFWDPVTGHQLNAVSDAPIAERGVSISPDGRLVASGAANGEVHLWDLADPAAACLAVAPYVAKAQLAAALPPGRTPVVCTSLV